MAAALAMFLIARPVSAGTPVRDVTAELMCTCGCTMIVSTCDCELAAQMTKLVADQINEGKSKDQILQYLVDKYGEKVLAAPTKEGFNLTAWTLPFLALGGGAGVVGLAITKLVQRRDAGSASEGEVEALSAGEYGLRLERELQEFEGKGD